MRNFLFFLLMGALIWGWSKWRGGVSHPPGILIQTDPTQHLVDSSFLKLSRSGFEIRALAVISMQGRVLRTCWYPNDGVSDLSKYDVAIGWGRMSDSSVLDQLKFSQSNRFLFWRFYGQPPIPMDEIVSHATNTHLIPATGEIGRQITGLRRGELIQIEGCLVEAVKPGMYPWRSWLSRTDQGKGACEIIWVSRLTKIGPR